MGELIDDDLVGNTWGDVDMAGAITTHFGDYELSALPRNDS